MFLISMARNDLFESYLNAGFDYEEARDMASDMARRMWDFDPLDEWSDWND